MKHLMRSNVKLLSGECWSKKKINVKNVGYKEIERLKKKKKILQDFPNYEPSSTFSQHLLKNSRIPLENPPSPSFFAFYYYFSVSLASHSRSFLAHSFVAFHHACSSRDTTTALREKKKVEIYMRLGSRSYINSARRENAQFGVEVADPRLFFFITARCVLITLFYYVREEKERRRIFFFTPVAGGEN